jgi:hypothetical protein
VTVRPLFETAIVYAETPVLFQLKIRSSFPQPVKFSKLILEFSDPSYNITATAIDYDLSFAPKQFKTFQFKLQPKKNTDLKVPSLPSYSPPPPLY